MRHYATHPDQIGRRLAELDAEWDIERTLEANAATLALMGTLLGGFVNKRFLIFPVLVTGFLLQHALQGWCPPVPFFRKRGVRTATEIEHERYALKALRGDFPRAGTRHGTNSGRRGVTRSHRLNVAFYHLFGALAESERNLIKELAIAGLSAARARGRLGGRPRLNPKSGKVALARKLYADKSTSIAEICKTLNISRATLYRYIDK